MAQYHLTVTKGEVQREEGSFFFGAPFVLRTDQWALNCGLQKGSTGKVVYLISQEGGPTVELQHPLYAGETSADALTDLDPTHSKTLFAGLVRLGVTADKGYKSFFSQSDTVADLSYEIIQEAFL